MLSVAFFLWGLTFGHHQRTFDVSMFALAVALVLAGHERWRARRPRAIRGDAT